MAWVYYNEFDKNAAAWLRELIKENLIAPGEVDERSIEDVLPSELAGFTQCHFFAGIGGWSYALRLAGWPDYRPVWTGSCPCQPFSSAGKGEGFADERHLWPAWHHLIGQRKPPVIFGEQVESAIRHEWLDLVQDDLEGLGYAVGTIGLPAPSVGAAHIRQRIWFVADAADDRRPWSGSCGTTEERWQSRPECIGQLPDGFERHGITGELVDGQKPRLEGRRGLGEIKIPQGWSGAQRHGSETGESGRVADTEGKRNSGRSAEILTPTGKPERTDVFNDFGSSSLSGTASSSSPTNGFWRDADWLFCRDGKWRPVEPGTFPLVNGLPRGMVHYSDPGEPFDAQKTSEARVMRLKGYGNAIVPEVAAEVIRAYMEIVG